MRRDDNGMERNEMERAVMPCSALQCDAVEVQRGKNTVVQKTERR